MEHQPVPSQLSHERHSTPPHHVAAAAQPLSSGTENETMSSMEQYFGEQFQYLVKAVQKDDTPKGCDVGPAGNQDVSLAANNEAGNEDVAMPPDETKRRHKMAESAASSKRRSLSADASIKPYKAGKRAAKAQRQAAKAQRQAAKEERRRTAKVEKWAIKVESHDASSSKEKSAASSNKQRRAANKEKSRKKRLLAQIETGLDPRQPPIEATAGLLTPATPTTAFSSPSFYANPAALHLRTSADDWTPCIGPKAPKPCVPDPLDDRPEVVSDEEKERKKQRRQAERQVLVELKKRECEERQRQREAEQTKRSGLLRLPVEVRLKIWRELLVSPAPVLVHDAWRSVYKRQRRRRATYAHDAALRYPAILATCRRISQEAVQVLYGGNVFYYLLRDAVGSDSSSNSSSSNRNGNTRVAKAKAPPLRRQRAANKQPEPPEPYIRVDKHLGLFRHLVVEAEHNRSSAATRDAMARALRVFEQRPDPRRQPVAPKRKRKALQMEHFVQPKIRTLTIKVTPRWVHHDGDDDGDENNGDGNNGGENNTAATPRGHCTFVDFFNPDCAVIPAIQAVPNRFLYIEVMGEYTEGSRRRSGCRLFIDRFYHSSAFSKNDAWKEDKQMRLRRKHKIQDLLYAIENLGKSVESHCNKYFGPKSVSMAEWNDDDWQNFDEQVFDHGNLDNGNLDHSNPDNGDSDQYYPSQDED